MANPGTSTQPRLLSFSSATLALPIPCLLLPFSLYPHLLLLLICPVWLPKSLHSLAYVPVSSPPAEALNTPDNSRKVGLNLPSPPTPRAPGSWAPQQSSVTPSLGHFGLHPLWKVLLLVASGKAVRSVGSGGDGESHGLAPVSLRLVSWTPAFTTWHLQTPTPGLLTASCDPQPIPPWIKDGEDGSSTASLSPFPPPRLCSQTPSSSSSPSAPSSPSSPGPIPSHCSCSLACFLSPSPPLPSVLLPLPPFF